MYLMCAESYHRKLRLETQFPELRVPVNQCKIYVYIYSKAVVLLLMAIYKKIKLPLVKNIPKISAGCQTKMTTCFHGNI